MLPAIPNPTTFTHNPLQASNAGGSGNQDAFVTKLSATGNSLVYSTYLGGSNTGGNPGDDVGKGIAVDSSGEAFVTGLSKSNDFPRVNFTLSYYPGAFVTKFNAAGSALVYSTFVSGEYYDEGDAIAVDSGGNAYVTGYTDSYDRPIYNPLQASLDSSDDAFVTEFGPSDTLLFSTYLGGGSYDQGNAIAADSHGNVYVAGETMSTDFPTSNALYSNPGSTPITIDAFVTKIYTGATPTTTGDFRP